MLRRINIFCDWVDNWPWPGLLLSALFLLCMFEADALRHSNDNGQQRGFRVEQQSGYGAISDSHEAKSTEELSSDTGREFKLTDWFLVAFNGLLALFTYRLFVSTDRLFGATKESADAAKAATDALPKVERGYIFLDGNVGYTIYYSPNHAYAKFKFRNHGKTPVVLTSIYQYFSYFPRGKNLEKILKLPLPISPEMPVAAGGVSEEFEVKGLFTTEEYDAAREGEGVLALIVRVGYIDIFDASRETAFCQKLTSCYGFTTYRSSLLNRRT